MDGAGADTGGAAALRHPTAGTIRGTLNAIPWMLLHPCGGCCQARRCKPWVVLGGCALLVAANRQHAGRDGHHCDDRYRRPAPALPPLTAAERRWVGIRRWPARPTAVAAVAASIPRRTQHRSTSVRRRAGGGRHVGVARAAQGWGRALEALAARRSHPTVCGGVGGRSRRRGGHGPSRGAPGSGARARSPRVAGVKEPLTRLLQPRASIGSAGWGASRRAEIVNLPRGCNSRATSGRRREAPAAARACHSQRRWVAPPRRRSCECRPWAVAGHFPGRRRGRRREGGGCPARHRRHG